MRKADRQFQEAMERHKGDKSERCCTGMDLLHDLYEQACGSSSPAKASGVGFPMFYGKGGFERAKRPYFMFHGNGLALNLCPVCGHSYEVKS